MVHYSDKKCLYFTKLILQWSLITVLLYQSHLALRDSDKSTFENRVKEGIDWHYYNNPGYRDYMMIGMGIDR